jgi:hypothetical protein
MDCTVIQAVGFNDGAIGRPYRSLALTLTTAFVFLSSASDSSFAGDSQQSECRNVRLISVDIPPDSVFRKDEGISKPPKLYVRIKKNGVEFAWHSSKVNGWSVTFPVNEDVNYWPIRVGTTDQYDVEIWDSNLFFDHLILTITPLEGKCFRGEIVEKADPLTSKDRRVKVVFEDQGEYPKKK